MQATRFHDRAYWLSLAPGLRIEDRARSDNIDSVEFSPALAAQFREDGYLQGSADWGADAKLMADAVRSLCAASLPPLFAYLFDEFWYPLFKLHNLYRALLGDRYCLLPDLWVFNVDPSRGEAGWRPHRDKGRRALFEDGSPKSLTTWIPLSRATPLNGCLYVVPAQQDPTYATADENEMRFEYQSIRALPARAGDFFIWNQALFHWGGAKPRRARAKPASALHSSFSVAISPRLARRCWTRRASCRSRLGSIWLRVSSIAIGTCTSSIRPLSESFRSHRADRAARRPDGSGATRVGTSRVAQAAADGYQFVLGSTNPRSRSSWRKSAQDRRAG